MNSWIPLPPLSIVLPILVLAGLTTWIVIRKPGIQMRGAMLAAAAAYFFWGMALSLASFIRFSKAFSSGAEGPSRLSEMMGATLTCAAATVIVTFVSAIVTAGLFAIHKPSGAQRPHHE